MIRGIPLGLALGALVAAAPVSAQVQPTVTEDQVDTWILEVDGADWAARPATPTFSGDTGLIRLSTAYTLPKSRFSFSYFYDNQDRDPKDIDFGVHGVTLGYGVAERLEVFGSLGLQNRADVDALGQAGYYNDLPFAGTSSDSPGWQTGFGDVWLGAKYKFLDDYLGDGVGLSVRGQVKLPTADDEKGLGTGKFGSYFDLVLSKHLDRKADVHASVGFKTHSSPDNVTLSNAVTYGVGVNVPAHKRVALQAELVGTSYSDSDLDQTDPLDLVIGGVIWFGKGWYVRPAYSINLNFNDRGLGSGSASYSGIVASVGYHPGTPRAEIYVPPPPPVAPPNKAPTVACKPDKTEILPGERVTCRATGSDPDGDPLTYRWSASAGSVTGDGASATFDSAGVVAPASVTVSVEASDGRGGTATASCGTITVKEPPKPEAVKCTSGGFPRNSDRLNNVDKACLDDVAQRLRQDPRSRVMIVGHADGAERYTEVVSRKRAEAVKAYLVAERGIDEARIATRGAADAKPADMGTSAAAHAANRRVDVFFLPEGAMAPEDDD